MTARLQIPLPSPTAISRPFWEGCKGGKLLVQRCRDCEGLTFPPQPVCTRCLSPDTEWVEGAGRGAVYSYAVVWRPQTPAFKAPYVVAIIDLDEGYQMLSNVIDCEPSTVQVGMRVQVEFRIMSREITLPYFRPALASKTGRRAKRRATRTAAPAA